MKNIQSYIDSGIVSDYVLGLASTEQAAELERYMLEHPELNAAVLADQEALENFALEFSTPVPTSLKAKIWGALSTPTQTINVQQTQANNVQPIKVKADNVRPIKKAGGAYFKAASLAAILGLALMNFFFFAKWKNSEKKQDTVIAEMQNELLNSKLQRDTMANALAIMSNPATKMVMLNGMPNYEDCTAKVFWDKDKKTVYLMPSKMPEAPAGHQYQLWGIVDGKPVDAGMIAHNVTAADLQTMKGFDNAQAFAITLETEGGNPTPNMEKLIVMGKI